MIYIVSQVRDRIDNFRSFMENIKECFLVENTKNKIGRSKIRSQYFVVKEKDKDEFLLLGIKNLGNFQKVFSFEKMAMETFIKNYGTSYFNETRIKDPIEHIMFYEDEFDMWRNGSFDIEKDKELQKEFMNELKESGDNMEFNSWKNILDDMKYNINEFEVDEMKERESKDRKHIVKFTYDNPETDDYIRENNKTDLFEEERAVDDLDCLNHDKEIEEEVDLLNLYDPPLEDKLVIEKEIEKEFTKKELDNEINAEEEI